ncbi:hypothetical protein ACFFTU_17920 [Streptomyces cremeus]|uniref:Uncharacterized protein n=1 Tax=Streptomyces cremeus TaxID=66881 RepID=A0ABV5PF40_STRCM
MSEISNAAHVTCVKQKHVRERCEAAKYRSLIAELSGFAAVRCASDAD